jgi:CheY-like chemotaxis protein
MSGGDESASRATKVLLVEDDEMVREFAETMLRVLGFEPCAAGDGETALRILDEQSDIRLMLTDIGLPGAYDGPTLAVEARRRRPDLPVLFASGSVDSEGKAAKLPPGTGVLAKPYRKAELAQRLRDLLPKN